MKGAPRAKQTAGTRRSIPVMVVVAAAIASWAAVPRARAALVVYELSPATSVGATSNVQALTSGQASAFSSVTGMARLRVDTPRTHHSLSSRVAYTYYFVDGVRPTLAGDVNGSSSFDLSGAASLSLGAGAMITRTATVASLDLAGQATVPGSRLFVASSASQGLTYLATTRLSLSQGFGVNRVDYLTSSFETSPTGRSSTGLSARLGGSYAWRIDSLSLGGTGMILMANAGLDPLGNPVPAGNTLLGQGLAGWRRDLSTTWSAELQGGVGWMVPPSGKVLVLPAGIATIGYRHLPWYATLMLQHAAAPNLFLGIATINTQAALTVTLPLDRGERYVLAGFGSFARADVTDPVAGAYNYNLISVGSSLSVRFRDLPLFGSVTYTLIDQHGTAPMGGTLDVVRHTVMVNLTAAFMWGPGTPPVGGGAGPI
jgi:hypothetical protein